MSEIDKKKVMKEENTEQQLSSMNSQQVSMEAQKKMEEKEVRDNLDAMVNLNLPDKFKEKYPLLDKNDFATSKLDNKQIERARIMHERENIQRRSIQNNSDQVLKVTDKKNLMHPMKRASMNPEQILGTMLAGDEFEQVKNHTEEIEVESLFYTRMNKSERGWLGNLLESIVSRMERSDDKNDSGGGLFGLFG